MASSIPAQVRTVDPYASYNSNVVNNLTGIVTRGSNALDYYNSLQIVPNDGTDVLTSVQLLPGTIYKDDVLIQITSSHIVDFTDPDQYVSASGDPLNTEPGIYYIVLEYSYTKSRPAPQANVKILLPSQRSTFNAGTIPALFFLKAVDVVVTGGSGSIDALYDYDPENPDTKREYIRNYASNDIFLPTHDALRDQGRLTYVSDEDEFYLGHSDRWENIGGAGAEFEADTSGFAIGDLVYVTSGGSLAKAISTLSNYTADGVVTKIGINGRVQTVGRVIDVPIETGNNVSTGQLLYLSGTEPGTVTKDKTSPFWQFVGRTISSDTTSAEVLFVRGVPEGTPTANLSKFQYTPMDSTAGWVWDAGSSKYTQDIDISAFVGRDLVIDMFDPDNYGRKFEPADLEFVDDNNVRVYMTTASKNPEVCILGKSAQTIGSSDVATVTATLAPPSWIFYAPANNYYQDVDVSDLKDGKGAVTIHDAATNKVIEPEQVLFWDSTTISISMPTNTETLNVTIIGDSNIGGSSNVTFATTLAAGSSWNASGGKYYQDVDVSELGLNTAEVVIGTRDFDTDFKIHVDELEFISQTVIRVWMPVDTVNVAVTING